MSKYKKNAVVPTGETEFQFKEGNINLHSEGYTWLVIFGPMAIYEGSGTIHSSGNYGFMVTVIDEKYTSSIDTNRFRIAIWDKDKGDALVYDNERGAAPGVIPTTELDKGNVALHQISVAAAATTEYPLVVIGNPPADLLERLTGTTNDKDNAVIFLPLITR